MSRRHQHEAGRGGWIRAGGLGLLVVVALVWYGLVSLVIDVARWLG